MYLCDKCPFEPIVVEKAEEKVVDDERICTFIGEIKFFLFKVRTIRHLPVPGV